MLPSETQPVNQRITASRQVISATQPQFSANTKTMSQIHPSTTLLAPDAASYLGNVNSQQPTKSVPLKGLERNAAQDSQKCYSLGVLPKSQQLPARDSDTESIHSEDMFERTDCCVQGRQER